MTNTATAASSLPTLPGTRSTSGLKYYPEGGWGWIVVISVFITQVITTGLHLSFGVTFYVFQVVNYADRNLTAWSGSLSFGISHLLSPLILCFTFKFGPRKMALVSAVSTIVSLILCSFTTSPLLFVLCYGLLFGVASSICLVTSFIILCQYFSKKRIRVFAIAHSGGGFGAALLSPLIFECARYSGWFLALLTPSLLSLLLIPLACAFRPVEMYYPGRLKPTTPKTPSKLLDTLPPVNPLAIRSFQLWLLVMFFTSLGFYVPVSLLIDVCVSGSSLSSSNSVIMLVIMGLLYALGCALTASFHEFNSDRQLLQLRTIIHICLFMATVAMALLIMDQSLPSLLIFVALYGLSYGSVRTFSVAFLHELMGIKLFSHSWALQNCVSGVGFVLGLPIALYIRGLVSGSYQATSLLFAAISHLLGFILMFGMKRLMQDPSRAFIATLDYPPTTFIHSASNGDTSKAEYESEIKAPKFEVVSSMMSSAEDETIGVKSSLANQLSLKDSHDSLYQTISPTQLNEDSRRQESLGVPDVNDHGSNGRTSSFGSSALVSPTDNSSMENSTMLRNRVNEQHDVIGNVSNNIAEKHIERINQHSGSFELDENGSRCDVPGVLTDDPHDYTDLPEKRIQSYMHPKKLIQSPVSSSDSSRKTQSPFSVNQRSQMGSPNNFGSMVRNVHNNNNLCYNSNNNNPDQSLSSPGSTGSAQRKKRLPPDPNLFPEYYENSASSEFNSTPTNSQTMSKIAHIERRMNQYTYANMTTPRRYETNRLAAELTTTRAVKHRIGNAQKREVYEDSQRFTEDGSPLRAYEPPWKNQLSMDMSQLTSEESSDQFPSPTESVVNQESRLRNSDVYLAFSDNDRESIL
ncbi:monocarboxylate transporter 8-like isoform X2 [Symsagittifera roscoffensis]|uniref:monocarboxylate transporter 8-like isoform X2 n=1 Tax=Symsagittifera roscoffensis TaxID=84072 RepID=UPI00307C376C